ncbi:hypothetical protein LJC60_04760 [Ruminococcaceae bacterium OttesenSCG-928-D13]|nr:hypothetical protein [Ruminococcaceae bacterium OttesenSCG-928-D13]
MRIRYIGMDKRTRITEANRVKFMSDGWKSGDKKYEVDESIRGPVAVVHTDRGKSGGKRLVIPLPGNFDIEGAKVHLLENGWLDLSALPVAIENLY